MHQTKQQRESRYKVGQCIRIIHLEGEDTRYDGKEGVIERIDGIGQLHGTWGGRVFVPPWATSGLAEGSNWLQDVSFGD